jgi:hypothetical protein
MVTVCVPSGWIVVLDTDPFGFDLSIEPGQTLVNVRSHSLPADNSRTTLPVVVRELPMNPIGPGGSKRQFKGASNTGRQHGSLLRASWRCRAKNASQNECGNPCRAHWWASQQGDMVFHYGPLLNAVNTRSTKPMSCAAV